MSLSFRKPWWQFRLRTLLIVFTLIAVAILPAQYFWKNRWRYRYYESPSKMQQRTQQWLRQNPSPPASGATMHSQESDLPSP